MTASRSKLTLIDLYRDARRRLKEAGMETPDLDARVLLEHFTGTTRVDMIADPGRRIESNRIEAVEAGIVRRAGGEPVHRIIGHRDFYGLRLKLSRGTLEPRPDTETLVDSVLPFLRDMQSAGISPSIIDLGTGTGAIALALLRELPLATALGVDVSPDALATAAENAHALALAERFETRLSDWFSAVSEKFHAIVSNPPYIPSETVKLLSREVRDFDPLAALDGGPDGLGPYRTIANRSAEHLKRGGVVAVEIGHDQLSQVTSLFLHAGFDLAYTGSDLLEHARALVFSKV